MALRRPFTIGPQLFNNATVLSLLRYCSASNSESRTHTSSAYEATKIFDQIFNIPVTATYFMSSMAQQDWIWRNVHNYASKSYHRPRESALQMDCLFRSPRMRVDPFPRREGIFLQNVWKGHGDLAGTLRMVHAQSNEMMAIDGSINARVTAINHAIFKLTQRESKEWIRSWPQWI